MGKTGRKNKTYSTEFKVNVIMDMREHHMGYRERQESIALYGSQKPQQPVWSKDGNAYFWKKEPKVL